MGMMQPVRAFTQPLTDSETYRLTRTRGGSSTSASKEFPFDAEVNDTYARSGLGDVRSVGLSLVHFFAPEASGVGFDPQSRAMSTGKWLLIAANRQLCSLNHICVLKALSKGSVNHCCCIWLSVV